MLFCLIFIIAFMSSSVDARPVEGTGFPTTFDGKENSTRLYTVTSEQLSTSSPPKQALQVPVVETKAPPDAKDPRAMSGLVGLFAVGLPMLTIFPMILLLIAELIVQRQKRRVGVVIDEESGQHEEQPRTAGFWQIFHVETESGRKIHGENNKTEGEDDDFHASGLVEIDPTIFD